MQIEKLDLNFKKAILNKLPDKLPFWKLLGLELIDVERGWAKMLLPFSEKLTNALGISHGGALFSLADSAGSIAAVSIATKGEFVTTIEMKINYIKPFIRGDAAAEAKIVHCVKSLAFVDVNIKDDEGNIIAKCAGNFLRKISD
jgi:acyl-CoA thioesterase